MESTVHRGSLSALTRVSLMSLRWTSPIPLSKWLATLGPPSHALPNSTLFVSTNDSVNLRDTPVSFNWTTSKSGPLQCPIGLYRMFSAGPFQVNVCLIRFPESLFIRLSFSICTDRVQAFIRELESARLQEKLFKLYWSSAIFEKWIQSNTLSICIICSRLVWLNFFLILVDYPRSFQNWVIVQVGRCPSDPLSKKFF